MTDWQVTATCIYCDAVDDDVTIIVNKDWSTVCTGYRKYVTDPDQETIRLLKKKTGQTGRVLKCEGLQDHRITDYRDKLLNEDKKSS